MTKGMVKVNTHATSIVRNVTGMLTRKLAHHSVIHSPIVQKFAVLTFASAALVGAAACGQSQESLPASAVSPTVSAPSSDSVTPDGHVLSESQVTALNESIHDAQSNKSLPLAEAHPTYRMDNGTMTIVSSKDESNIEQDAGTYALIVQCIGSGDLNIAFTMGEETANTLLACPDADISSATLTLHVGTTQRSVVEITPTAGTKAEYAYCIDKTE